MNGAKVDWENPVKPTPARKRPAAAIHKVGLFIKDDAQAAAKAEEFADWLKARQIAVVSRTSTDSLRRPGNGNAKPPKGLYCVFVLGGDGTFLSAVRWIGDRETPLLGVKFGNLGFLAEISEENLFEAADRVLNGEYKISARMRMDVQVTRRGKCFIRETVLNDIVINRAALARLANVVTHINGHYLTTFRADGLIIATPTGSTAYSLAAGGPVIHPKVPGLILTPICPFTLTNRPLIVPDDVEITLRLDKGSSDIVLTLDGQTGLNITDKDVITVRRSNHPLHLILLPDRHYFDVLKSKLRWSGGRV
jgi:NAD+ kinase